MQTPRWITWDEHGEACVWERKPYYSVVDQCWDHCKDNPLAEACVLRKKRGGPKAIRRIRLEKI